ncbi:hypothetical protein ABZX51_003160 [Aspergillus tubingensis]
MKFNSAIALSSLLALAVAQDSSSTTSAATTTASLSPQASCATKCSASDICCIASCYSVPCPDNAQANDTTSCVAACPQGSGSPSDQKSYASCQSSCYSSYFLPATATGASGSSATTAGSNDASTTKSGSSSSSTGSGTSTFNIPIHLYFLTNHFLQQQQAPTPSPAPELAPRLVLTPAAPRTPLLLRSSSWAFPQPVFLASSWLLGLCK